MATWYKEQTHWKRLWCWERLKEGEGDNREWDDWMASQIQWTWVWKTLGDSEGQGSLVYYSPWGHKESDMTERLNNNHPLWTWDSKRLRHFLVVKKHAESRRALELRFINFKSRELFFFFNIIWNYSSQYFPWTQYSALHIRKWKYNLTNTPLSKWSWLFRQYMSRMFKHHFHVYSTSPWINEGMSTLLP